MPKSFRELHAEETELVMLERAGKNVADRLDVVRKQMVAHHDRLFDIDTSPEAVSRRLGLPYIGLQRPGSDFRGGNDDRG